MYYETVFEEAADQKMRQYADLVEKVGKQGYYCQFIQLQVVNTG